MRVWLCEEHTASNLQRLWQSHMQTNRISIFPSGCFPFGRLLFLLKAIFPSIHHAVIPGRPQKRVISATSIATPPAGLQTDASPNPTDLLHTASCTFSKRILAGNVDFEIVTQQKEKWFEVNARGFSPLHHLSAKFVSPNPIFTPRCLRQQRIR